MTQITDHAALMDIQTIIDNLGADSAVSKDARAIKSMKRVANVMERWNAHEPSTSTIIDVHMPTFTCAVCGRANPSIVSGGEWFCDMKCVNKQVAIKK